MFVKTDNDGDPVVVIPPTSGGVMRYGMGLFILFWLGGWFFGFRSASSQLLAGNLQNKAFLVFWLAAWTIGGAFALYYVYRIFRPSIPETIALKGRGLLYDSGIPPIQLTSFYGYGYRYIDRRDAWKSLFPKRTRVEIDRNQLASLRLRETDAGNRLTVDANASRLDLAMCATEVDREWLYRTLAQRYALTNALAS
jgi:hypothetical protein